MNKLNITNLYKKEYFSEIDFYFAKFILDISENNNEDIFLGAALASMVTQEGNVCLDLNSYAFRVLSQMQEGSAVFRCPELLAWRKTLLSSRAVGAPNDFAPLILDDKNRLYLYRFWKNERQVADFIKKAVVKKNMPVNKTLLKASIERLFPEKIKNEINWQKIAGVIPVFKRFTVISGGPGTGKTTVIAKILAIIIEQFIDRRAGETEKNLRIFLAAPTGKAAARMNESIINAKKKLACDDQVKELIPGDACTIHRLLKAVKNSYGFFYNAANLLPADLVVIDEASMVDLAMMQSLVQALPEHANLILVGDKDQLASVDAGSLLGDICDRNNVHEFSDSFSAEINDAIGDKCFVSKNESRYGSDLSDCIVLLKKNYRFAAGSGALELGSAVNHGRADRALELIKSRKNLKWKSIESADELYESLSKIIIEKYAEFFKTDDPKKALEELNRFKILCPVKKGPFGVEGVNRLAERILLKAAEHNNAGKHHMRSMKLPVIITNNDYRLGLFNGDIGVIMHASGDDESYAFFYDSSGELKRFFPQRLSEYETAYAMTVHRSQGSEFDDILLLLPDRDSPVLTRELIYTGVTRARHNISIWGTEDILKASVLKKIERTSGLRDALWE